MSNDNHTVKLKTEVTCPNCGEEIEIEAEAKLEKGTKWVEEAKEG